MRIDDDPNDTSDITRDELSEIDADVVDFVQTLKRLNTDLVVGMKLLESEAAKDHVSGAAVSTEEQRRQLVRRAEKQRRILAELKEKLDASAQNPSNVQ